MIEFVRIAELTDLNERKGISRKLGDDEIALVKLNGRIFAFLNVCPHQHTKLVDSYGGQIDGYNLTCPMHGWTYDLRSGECLNESGRLKMLEVKIEGNVIFVENTPKEFSW
jgi:3-phenylpropionate/trans-cinnamate dioxygenase ferredoxin subunit